MKKLLIAGATLAALALATTPALAKPYAAGGVTAQEVADALKARGLKADIQTDGQGDPMIKSASDGVNWTVYFYSCKSGRCASIQFSAGFDLNDGITAAKANEWNYTKRFARAALDDEMDPYIRYDIDAERGFTSEGLDLAIETYQLVLPVFTDFIGYN